MIFSTNTHISYLNVHLKESSPIKPVYIGVESIRSPVKLARGDHPDEL